jgi:hypothetical protein
MLKNPDAPTVLGDQRHTMVPLAYRGRPIWRMLERLMEKAHSCRWVRTATEEHVSFDKVYLFVVGA